MRKSLLQLLKYLTVFVVLLVTFLGCLKEDELNLLYNTNIPIDLKDGLEISNPGDQNIDANALNDIYQSAYRAPDLWSLRSLLVFRNDKLVAEAYLKDKQDITQRHLVWSCTKQILAVLVGKAIEESAIADINDPISDYFTSELFNHQDKASITLRNLITMQSGLDFENSGLGSDNDKLLRQIPDNSLDYVLGLPLNQEQGTEFHYNDGNPHILSAIIQKQVGKPTDNWADEVLFSKIGFQNYNWARYRDGLTMGPWGIETTPREMAKIALLVANLGKWNGEQLVSEKWIEEMTTVQVEETEEVGLSFGYFWWIDQSRNVFFMDGHGGQFAFIVPDKELIVVMTAIPNTEGDYQILYDEALKWVDKIIEISY